MIEKVVRSAAARPFLAVTLALAAAVFGAIAFRELPRDVFPDLSAPVFNVIVQNPTMAAEELESSLSIPMETALAGLPGARRVRSLNQLGVSQISVEFEPEADYQRSRQLVAERVQEATARLPPGTEPPLISSLTGRLNEVMELSLEARARQGRPDDLARPGRIRAPESLARRLRGFGGRAARRLPAAIPGADRSRSHGGTRCLAR